MTDDADLELARCAAILFGAVGTAGQRCTSTRRVIVQKRIADELIGRLVTTYKQVRIGDPLDGKTLMGPLIDAGAVEDDDGGPRDAQRSEGGSVLYGGKTMATGRRYFVEPTIVEGPQRTLEIVAGRDLRSDPLRL